jgi:hypothetical protein
MKLNPFTFVALLITFVSFAQEPALEDTSLNGQFDGLYRVSNTYQAYKIIGKESYMQLKQNVLDSLKTAKKKLSEKNNLLITARASSAKNQELLTSLSLDLEASEKKENDISLFGASIKKTNYNLSLWTFILTLILALLFFIFKFTTNHTLSNKAQNDLKDLDFEFEQYRRKSIEREQKLRRTLQDEINKQRNS